MVAIENTHAHSMGQPLTPEYTRAIADVAHRHGVPLHVDGARFWDAVVALGVRPTDLAGPADSVTFCLSKGLGCPVGSVVVGDRAFIWRARRLASWSVAECARWASSRRQGSSRCATAPKA